MLRAAAVLAFVALASALPVAAETAPDLADSQRWLNTLAADAAAGRRTGTAAQQRIGVWLADEFKTLGLQPLGDSYFQLFAVTNKDGSQTIGRNVLAVLPGTQPTAQAEYLLLSAHYDHIGHQAGSGADHVFNGADDNASGVTAMLNIAKRLQQAAANGQRPARHIVFAAWDAEEMGLKGSAHFVAQPLLPLDRIVANLNFEMVGVTEGKNRRNLWMTGWQHSELFEQIKPMLAAQGWTLEADPYPQWDLFLRSDNAPFASMKNIGSEAQPHWLGVPAHSLSVWRGQRHYHAVTDEMALIDLENLTALSSAMTVVVQELAKPERQIAWKPETTPRFSRLPAAGADAATETMTGSP